MADFTAQKAFLALLCLGLILPCLSLKAQPRPGSQYTVSLPNSTFMSVGGPASVPFGWADFCQRYKGECVHGTEVSQDLKLTAKVWKQALSISQKVNRMVTPETDLEHWGVLDQWDYPYDGKGDCEDFALFKRNLLIEAGFPRQALLMSVVKDEHNEGHAVLTLKTDRGEFVLDNLSDEIKPWEETGYRFVKRQSQSDENLWVQIGEPTAPPDYVSR